MYAPFAHSRKLPMNSPDFCFPPAPVTTLPVVGDSRVFPVRRVFCVGRTYAAHAREMGGDPTREPPFFFAKPADGLVVVADGVTGEVHYPPVTRDLHHEVEMVVAIGTGGADIPAESASSHLFGYAIGLDLTRRDLQAALKAKGQPWEMGKAFDESAPISPLVRLPAAPASGEIWLDVNGQRKQQGDLADMIWPVADIVAQLSRLVRLAAGDLIFTGTPEGVGPLVRDDLVTAGIAGVGRLSLRIV